MSDQPGLFDERLPYQPHSPTSREAAEAAKPTAATMRMKVLAYLQGCGPATDEQMQITLQMNPSTQRPRRIELVQRGLVRDSGREGKTRSGSKAVIWEAVEG